MVKRYTKMKHKKNFLVINERKKIDFFEFYIFSVVFENLVKKKNIELEEGGHINIVFYINKGTCQNIEFLCRFV